MHHNKLLCAEGQATMLIKQAKKNRFKFESKLQTKAKIAHLELISRYKAKVAHLLTRASSPHGQVAHQSK